LRKAINRLEQGMDPLPPTVTLSDFIAQRWAPHLRLNGHVRARTLDGYERLLRNWVTPRIGGVRLVQVMPLHVQSVLDAMVEAGRAPRTVSSARAAMSSVFTLAVRWGIITVNPVRAAQAPTACEPNLTIPTPKQLMGLVEAARGTKWEIPVLLSATTGARRGEVLGLRWRCVDLDRGRIRIVEAMQRQPDGALSFVPPKTARAVREVPLPNFVSERLRAHRAAQGERRLALGSHWHDHDLVCESGDGSPLNPDNYTYGFGVIAEVVGLDNVRLHDLRHGVATALANSGTPAVVTSRMLGHASVAFTLSTYTHVDDEQIDRAAKGLEQAFGS
jgi:integrase